MNDSRVATTYSAKPSIGALASTRLIAAKLFDVTPTDTRTFVSSLVVLIAVATLAAWIPARRATRVQPSEALRAD